MPPLSPSSQSVPFLARPEIATLLGLVIVVAVPFIIKFYEPMSYFVDQQSINSFAGSVVVIMLGRFLTKRMEHFPGVSSGAIIAISYLSSFTLVALAFLFLRLDYSRVIFLSGSGAATLWFIGIYLYRQRFIVLNFSCIPGTDIISKIGLPNVQLHELESTSDFDSVGGAVIADLRADIPTEWVQFLSECALREIPVYHVKHVREHLTGIVQIETISENNLGSILPSRAYLGLKRLVDTIAALILLPFLLVGLVILAPIMLATQGGPVFYTQRRIGRGGREFTMYKLRTMHNAVSNGEPEHHDDQRNAAETKHEDPRITPIGRFLRKFRIDELPQLFNVLRGEMSWIGPRPEAAILGSMYEEIVPFYKYRYIVRPGITGWAQVNQGHVTDVNDIGLKLQYDFYYIKNISAWLDLLIAVRTIKIVLQGFGSK